MPRINAISVIGLGKLGLCSAACFAKAGFQVIGVDIDREKINAINRSQSPVEETGLAQLLKKIKNKLLATHDYERAVLETDVSFVVVATPSLSGGGFSNVYLEKALGHIGSAIAKKDTYHLVVVTSTVMPGTIETVAKFILEKASGKKAGKDFGVAYNPEFIALGSVIHDFLNPDFILIGEMDRRDGDTLESMYRRTCQRPVRFARMSCVNAEITKLALNCYITTRITFVNQLSGLCDAIAGADAFAITAALGLDGRIGPRYLRPGLGYGGPCFPRDNIAFAACAGKVGVETKLAAAVDTVNRDQVRRVFERVKALVKPHGRCGRAPTAAVLGLAYKPNTPVVEDSQALSIAQLLVSGGYSVIVYDPQAMNNARSILGDSVFYASSAQAAVGKADVVIVAVPWGEFKKINWRKKDKRPVVLDCWGIVKSIKGLHVTYLGVGARGRYET